MGSQFREGLSIVHHEDVVAVDQAGREKFRISRTDGFPNLHPFSQGRAVLEYDGLMGCVDRSGKIVIPIKFFCLEAFQSDYAVAWLPDDTTKDGYSAGYIDLEGQWKISPRFHNVSSFSGEYAAVDVKGKDGEMRRGLINKQGSWVVPPNWRACGEHDRPDVTRVWSGSFLACHNSVPTLVNEMGRAHMMPQYQDVSFIGGGYLKARIGIPKGFDRAAWIIVRPDGSALNAYRYHEIGSFRDGVFDVRTHARWRFVNESGDTMRLGEYRTVENCDDCLAFVETMDGIVGFVHKNRGFVRAVDVSVRRKPPYVDDEWVGLAYDAVLKELGVPSNDRISNFESLAHDERFHGIESWMTTRELRESVRILEYLPSEGRREHLWLTRKQMGKWVVFMSYSVDSGVQF